MSGKSSEATMFRVPRGYEDLGAVFRLAVEQAAQGKGAQRHAVPGEPFRRQPICEIERRVGGGYCIGQAVKKIYESQRLDRQAGMQELLGAINYLAAAFIVIREPEIEEK